MHPWYLRPYNTEDLLKWFLFFRRSRRYTEKREGRRESELLKALESSMNKERNAAVAAAAAVASASSASNMPNASSSGQYPQKIQGVPKK